MVREQAPRILIVDDHEDNIELLRARLESRGYEIDTAEDGEQALERVAAHAPDLILLDVMMPRLDGFEVVRRLKANPELPFIPIIMQTALDSTEHKVEGLDAGADDYITKPINFAELEARVKSMLRIKGLQRELEQRERELQEVNLRLLRDGPDRRPHGARQPALPRAAPRGDVRALPAAQRAAGGGDV
jgi:DNA-binding response OmpR family regulator